MSLIQTYNLDTVPERSKEALQSTVKKYGTTLNIFADMAESPLPIEIYSFGQDQLMQRSTLGAEIVNLLQMAISVENDCEFCVPAHTAAALNKFKTDEQIVDAIREGRDGPDNTINALVNFTRQMVRYRGKLNDNQVQSFLDAGYSKEQIFEVLSVVAYKTITNYTSNLAGTQPNEPMIKYAWKPADDQQRQQKQAA